jgi:RecB family exonuclease
MNKRSTESMVITKTLFLAPGNERCRDFVQQWNTGKGILEALTPQQLVYRLWEHMPESLQYRKPDSIESHLGLEDCIRQLKLKVLNYLTDDPQEFPDTVDAIARFLYLVELNDKDILDDFGFEENLATDILKILSRYKSWMMKNSFIDYAGILRIVNSKDLKQIMLPYGSIIMDSFQKGGVNLLNNQQEQKLITSISELDNVTMLQQKALNNRPVIKYTRVPTRIDELEQAARLARQLLHEGVSPEEIVISAGSLSSYLPHVHRIFDRYRVPVFISQGLPLCTFPVYSIIAEQLKKDKSIDDVIKGLYLYHKDCLKTADEHEDVTVRLSAARSLQALREALEFLNSLNANNSSYTPGELFSRFGADNPVYLFEEGVAFQELNQLTHRKFRHVILIGCDGQSLPPVTKDNFLITQQRLEESFGFNNSFDLSEYYLQQVKEGAENIHIITARREEKKQLELSPLVAEIFTVPPPVVESMDPVSFSLRDQLKTEKPKRIKCEQRDENYLKSKLAAAVTSYDGILDNPDISRDVWSVSRFNAYAACPMKYYFQYILYLDRSVTIETEEGLDPMSFGSIAHSCFEMFCNGVKKGKIDPGRELSKRIKKTMYDISSEALGNFLKENKIEETVFHRARMKEMTAGLLESVSEKQKGVLLRFLEMEYNTEQERVLAAFQEAEHPITENTPVKGISLRGFIDRIDNHEGLMHVIDYKPTKKVDIASQFEKITQFKDFQLPFYAFYTRDHLGAEAVEASLLSYRDGGNRFARFTVNDTGVTCENKQGRKSSEQVFLDGFEEQCEEAAYRIIENVKAGRFPAAPDDGACEYCSFSSICRQSEVEHKNYE